jgi:hypothetical protein
MGDRMLSYAIRYGTRGTPYDDNEDVWVLNGLNLDREFSIERLKQNLESYLQYGSDPRYDFLRYVMSTLKDVQDYQRPEYFEKYEPAFKLLPYAEKGFEEYGFTPGDPEHEADEDYVAAKKLLAAYRLKAKVFAQIVPMEADMRVKLGVIQNIRAAAYGGKYRPEHEEVETLYHATAFVTEILRDGFSAEKPMDRVGVGNFGRQVPISFSHDLEIARNIMRSFKEIWMIAHRQITMPVLLKWARAEGIEDAMKKSWGGIEGGGMPTGLNADPHDVVKVYRYWLSHTKLRSDPRLISPWEIVDMMMNRTLKDIGVLACQVRIRPEDEYLIGESEFRLPAEQVISVKQLL